MNDYIKDTTFNNNIEELDAQINKNGLDLFLIMTLNKIISNLPLSNFENKDFYKNLCDFAKKIFNPDKRPQYTNELFKILFLFFDSNNYNEKIKSKLINENGKIDIQIFEALLYGFRFCVNSLYDESNKKPDLIKYLYPSLLSANCEETIANSFIPGNDDKQDLHLITLEDIERHLNKKDKSVGCYVCSCGFYYDIPPCGFATNNMTFPCPMCLKKCGWGPKKIPEKGLQKHGMVIREGHYRIFKDKTQKALEMKKWGEVDENIPNKLLDEYINDIIEPIRKKSGYGFNNVDFYFFETQEKKTRKLSKIGYRLLNFISYCHLFYSFCSGFISEEKYKQCLIKDCDIIKIIQIDWNQLKDALAQQNVGSIQIFLNMIFKDLSKLLKEFEITKNEIDRENFENKVEELILQNINKYPEYSQKYTEENQKLSDLDINSLKTYVTELIHPSSESYSKNEYPMFKYFTYTKYKTIEDFKKNMKNKEKYPLINNFLNGTKEVEKLEYLPDFNEFTNYMVNYYSFKISREEARNRILEDEPITKEEGFNKKFGKFVNIWDKIKSFATKYKCRPDMEIKKNFTKKDKLINFLNDEGELYSGMYLAAACQSFISWQNAFLDSIVFANIANGILNNYVDNIKKKVPVQDAKINQILLINDRFNKNDRYKDFIDVVFAFSRRNIFDKNGKLNYSQYNSFVYDYDRIEEELGKIILPGVCLFEGEDVLNFVTYWGEGFRGGNSQIITKFYLKYNQKDLDDKEKQEVYKYITNKNINNENDIEEQKKKKYDFKEFFGSMNLLLFYLSEKGVLNEDEKIINIINNAPEYLKLSDDIKSFFNNEGKNFTLNKLMNVFFFFEHLCFDDLAETLLPEYKAPIQEEKKTIIIEKLINKKDPFDIIPLTSLAAATRRFISRYLAGNIQFVDIKGDRDLSFELTRAEFWEEKIGKLDDLIDLVSQKIFEFKLTVGQAYEFYNLIGDEDRNAIKFNVENK